MKRQALDDGRWFDVSKAEKFEEDTHWDGHNHVSNTAGKFNHEALYRTAGGRWIQHWWSQWQGSRDRWTEISNEDAARWLVSHNHDAHKACATEYAELEVK